MAEQEGYVFDFERLEVYQLGIVFVRKVFSVSARFSRHVQFSLGDQLRRAALSIVNNIAEGSGKNSTREKALFYSHAIHSARECVPMITVAFEQQEIDRAVHNDLRADIVRLCRMLAGLVKATGTVPSRLR